MSRKLETSLAMKKNLLIAALSQNLSRIALAITVFSVTASMASAGTAKSSAPEKHAATKVKSLAEQIRQYIELDGSLLPELEKGIVVISFSVDEHNRLQKVASHSRIKPLDTYLESRLEGKPVETTDAICGQQYVKLRFTIER